MNKPLSNKALLSTFCALLALSSFNTADAGWFRRRTSKIPPRPVPADPYKQNTQSLRSADCVAWVVTEYAVSSHAHYSQTPRLNGFYAQIEASDPNSPSPMRRIISESRFYPYDTNSSYSSWSGDSHAQQYAESFAREKAEEFVQNGICAASVNFRTTEKTVQVCIPSGGAQNCAGFYAGW